MKIAIKARLADNILEATEDLEIETVPNKSFSVSYTLRRSPRGGRCARRSDNNSDEPPVLHTVRRSYSSFTGIFALCSFSLPRSPVMHNGEDTGYGED